MVVGRGDFPGASGSRPSGRSVPPTAPLWFGGKKEERRLLRHSSGFYYREGTADLLTIRECLQNYSPVRLNGRRVLDLGANIGIFSGMATVAGATRVFAVEPESCNLGLLPLNAPDAELIQGAVVRVGTGDTIPLFIPDTNGGPSLTSTIPVRGRLIETVDAVPFERLLRLVEPQTLKMDIEGGEYDLIDLIPDSVDEFAIELHCLRSAWEGRYEGVKARLMEEWTVVRSHERKFYGKLSADLLLRR